MAIIIDMGHNPEAFQKLMGRGGVINSRPRQGLQGMKPSGQPESDSLSGIPKEWVDQITLEAWEAMHGEAMSPEKMAELGLSTTPTKADLQS